MATPLRVALRCPTLRQPVDETLDAGEVLLVGRDPDPARLDATLLPRGMRVRAVRVAAGSVSGNHCVLWRHEGRVVVRDLDSRNGTLAPLGPGGSAQVVVIDDALTVDLAPAPPEAPPPPVAAGPADARWERPEDFPDAVAREVTAWLSAAGLPVAAAVRRRGERKPASSRPSLPPIPLVDDLQLVLTEESSGTIDPLFGRVIEAVVGYVHAQAARLRGERAWRHDPSFVLASPGIREAHRKVAEAAERGHQLILLGETGAGKGTLARCYHLHSPRSSGAFESVNCAEIDKHFARTRLFGAKKGAYTGCHADLPGAVELAHGGTLFLDELVELPPEVQGELLTFLDDQRFKRLGDEQWRQVDVRVVCGTNSDLRRAVKDGRFRADLWYRLAGRIVEVPPLRERRGDVVAFLQGRSAGEAAGAASAWDALSPEARQRALEHPWRGNFRELAGFARRLPLGGGPGSVTLADCVEALREGSLEPDSAARGPSTGGGWEALVAQADALYRARAGAPEPARAGDFREYVEEILKPMFFARALGMEDIDALPERPVPTFEEMARRMGCDASTVKAQLSRYVEIRRRSP